MGIHRDGSSLGLNYFDIEMRRRLWWQIMILDARAAELTGSGRPGEAWYWNTKVPSNVNDCDLHPDMKEPPVDSAGPTDMISCLLRYELGVMFKRARSASDD